MLVVKCFKGHGIHVRCSIIGRNKTDKNPCVAIDVRADHGRKIKGIGKVSVIVLNWYTNDGRNT